MFPDIIAITETWLDNGVSDGKIFLLHTLFTIETPRAQVVSPISNQVDLIVFVIVIYRPNVSFVV